MTSRARCAVGAVFACALCASLVFAGCQIGVGPGGPPPAGPPGPPPGSAAGPPPASGPAVGGGGGETVSANPNCPTPANHCLAEDVMFAGKKAFTARYEYVFAARMTGQPGAGGDATFLSLNDGGELVTQHYYQTRAAQPGEVAVGTMVIMPHINRDGVYVAPETRDKAHKTRWWLARVTSVASADRGYVIVSGGYKIATNALRMVEGDTSPTVSVGGAEDAHYLKDEHWVVVPKGLPAKRYVYGFVGAAIQAPTAETKGDGHFISLQDGAIGWNKGFKTRPADKADLQVGTYAFMPHINRDGVYQAPESRLKSLSTRWWVAKIVDTSELYKGVVEVAGGYKIAAAAIRVQAN